MKEEMSSNACSKLDGVNVVIKNDQIVPMNDYNAVLYLQTDNLLQDTIAIIDSARDSAYRSVNTLMVIRNWQLGHRISVENFNGQKRAEYGKRVMAQLAADLTNRYGRGFDTSNLYKFLDFYRSFPQILDTASLKSIQLTWSHYRILLQEHDSKARQWYENEAITQMWSARTLQRNISSQYYQRMLLTQHSDLVEQEMHQLTTPLQNQPNISSFFRLKKNFVQKYKHKRTFIYCNIHLLNSQNLTKSHWLCEEQKTLDN